MFDDLFLFIDRIVGFFSELFDRGILFYVLLVLIGLLVISLIIVTFLMLTHKDAAEIPQEKLDIINNAPQFCREHNHNSWQWVNESVLIFRCVNITNEKPDLTKYYAP